MKKTRTRIVTLLLALVMCLGLLPVTAQAANKPNLVLPEPVKPSGSVWATVELMPGDVYPIEDFDYFSSGMVYYPEGTPPALTFSSYEELMEYYGTYTLTFCIDYAPTGIDYVQTYGPVDVVKDNPYYNPRFDFGFVRSNGMQLVGWRDADGKFYDMGCSWTLTQDTTVYSVWETIDTAYTVNFDSNGGTIDYAAQKVQCRETVQLPADPGMDGYTFLGWYMGTPKDGVLTNAFKWTDEKLVVTDVTLYAMWEETPKVSYTVTFDLNGAPGTPPAAQTVAAGSAVTQPANPVWEGHSFLGWYTEAEEQWNFSVPVTDSMTLIAKWEELKEYTVEFVAAGSTVYCLKIPKGGIIPGIYIEKANQIITALTQTPGYSMISGRSFLFWADENGDRWDGSEPVMDNLTVYAVWAEPEEDTFSFSNSGKYLLETYQISAKYYDYLKKNQPSNYQDYIDDKAAEDWGGSCFGLSAVYSLKYSGKLDMSTFQSDASSLYDLVMPQSDNQMVHDLINYYHLMQFTLPNNQYTGNCLKQSTVDRNELFVDNALDADHNVLLTFNFYDSDENEWAGHAIVAKSTARDSSGNYLISIWDSNAPFDEGTLVVSQDYKNAYFTESTSHADVYNNQLFLVSAIDIESNLYDYQNLQDFINGKEVELNQVELYNIYLLEVGLNQFTVTTPDGRSATVSNGVQTSGSLVLTPAAPFSGKSDGFAFYLDEADAKEFTIQANQEAAEISLLTPETRIAVCADDLRSVTFDDTTVTTNCASASEQTISFTSDKLGDTWNKVTVTGKDTGFTLEAGDGEVKISSDNDVSAAVTGMNVLTHKESAAQELNVTSHGVTVSTADSSLTPSQTTAEQPTVTNPFTDVKDTDWYYDAVMYVYEHGLMGGAGSADTFQPTMTTTRGMIMTILARMDGVDTNGGATWYEKGMNWAVSVGVSDGTNPGLDISREQLATMLYRYAQYKGCDVSGRSDLAAFPDASAVSSWAVEAMQWAVDAGLIGGNEKGQLDPGGDATRMVVATILMRFCENVVK